VAAFALSLYGGIWVSANIVSGVDIITFDPYLATLHHISQCRFGYYLCTSQIKDLEEGKIEGASETAEARPSMVE
jgi:hypothetical protein